MEEPDSFYRTLCSSETLRSGAKGFFRDFSETVIEEAGDTWIDKIFGRLENDEDRVRTVLTDPRVRSTVLDTLRRVKHLYRDKDPGVSRIKRLEGLDVAAKGDNEKALILFSQAVLRAPVTGLFPLVDQGFSYPLGLLARADTLMALGDYDYALDDLKLASEEDLPRTARTAGVKIKARICKNSTALEECVHNAVYENVAAGPGRTARLGQLLSHRTFLRKQLVEKIEECNRLLAGTDQSLVPWTSSEVANKSRKQFQKPAAPSVTGGSSSHKDLAGASRLVDIEETTSAGKHAVAAEEIRPGDVLASEPPLAACLLPEFYGTHCQHCLSRLRAPVGCPVCSSVAFCGRKCRDLAVATYHKYECKILALLIGSGMSVLSTLALRMVTQEGPERCRRMCEKLKRKKCSSSRLNVDEDAAADRREEDGNLSKSAKRRLRKKKLKENSQHHSEPNAGDPVVTTESKIDMRAYDLVTLSARRSPRDFLERALMAVFLLKGLQKVNFFATPSKSEESPTDEEVSIGALLLRNLQLLQFNAHEIYETRLAENHRFRGNKTVYVGIAIYPSVARFNHDCYPAVTRYYVGRSIVIRALRPLKAGDVIAENYGPIFTKRSVKDRQRSLAGRYWFRCVCLACTEDWPSFDNLTNHSARIRCPTEGCKGLLAQPRKQGRPVKCSKCQRMKNLEERMRKLEECEAEYTRGLASMEAEKTKEAMDILASALDKFHCIAAPPHRETHLAEIAFAACMADSGNTWRPIK